MASIKSCKPKKFTMLEVSLPLSPYVLYIYIYQTPVRFARRPGWSTCTSPGVDSPSRSQLPLARPSRCREHRKTRSHQRSSVVTRSLTHPPTHALSLSLSFCRAVRCLKALPHRGHSDGLAALTEASGVATCLYMELVSCLSPLNPSEVPFSKSHQPPSAHQLDMT